jgi:hypothetical protein
MVDDDGPAFEERALRRAHSDYHAQRAVDPIARLAEAWDLRGPLPPAAASIAR